MRSRKAPEQALQLRGEILYQAPRRKQRQQQLTTRGGKPKTSIRRWSTMSGSIKRGVRRVTFFQVSKTKLTRVPGVSVSKSKLRFLEIDRFRCHKKRLEMTKNELQIALAATSARYSAAARTSPTFPAFNADIAVSPCNSGWC